MRKVLWAVAVIAALALGSSIVSTVVLHSTTAKEARQIAVLNHRQSVEQKEISGLEVRTAKASARDGSASKDVLSVTAARREAPGARVQPAAHIEPGVAKTPPPDSGPS